MERGHEPRLATRTKPRHRATSGPLPPHPGTGKRGGRAVTSRTERATNVARWVGERGSAHSCRSAWIGDASVLARDLVIGARSGGGSWRFGDGPGHQGVTQRNCSIFPAGCGGYVKALITAASRSR